MSASKCRSCGADVLFVPSATTGRVMILDAKPEKRAVVFGPGRDLALEPSPNAPGANARVVDTFVDHHVTCPQSADWKGRRR